MAIEISEQFRFYGKKALEGRLNTATVGTRDNIPLGQRYNGMIVTVRSEGKRYELLYLGNFEALDGATKDAFLADNTKWEEYLPGQKLTKASQAQAEAGTDDAAYMTPLKTKQSVISNAVNVLRGSVATAGDTLKKLYVLIQGKVDKVANASLATDTEKARWDDKYTKGETDNLFIAFGTNLIWKADVATFADLATTYPTPQDNWTVVVDDESTTYRYDTATSTWVNIGNLSIPMATALLDGKLSKEDFVKLQGIEDGATADQTPAEIMAAYHSLANEYTDAEQTKLAGIASGATVNDTNANLRKRSTHTGVDPISSIEGFTAAPNGSIPSKDESGNGIWAPLPSGGTGYRRNFAPALQAEGLNEYVRVDEWQNMGKVTMLTLRAWCNDPMTLRLTDGDGNTILNNTDISNAYPYITTSIAVDIENAGLLRLDIKTIGLFYVKEIILT